MQSCPMRKRNTPLHIDEHIRLEIDSRLAAVEQTERVRLLVAVESGSRAWGFPSPDSDYDVRFIYVRPRDWYLALEPGRDVIEQPITGEIDLNGWDIRKTLGLLLGSNAIVSEWLSSPIRYRPDDPATARLVELVRHTFNPRGVDRFRGRRRGPGRHHRPHRRPHRRRAPHRQLRVRRQ